MSNGERLHVGSKITVNTDFIYGPSAKVSIFSCVRALLNKNKMLANKKYLSQNLNNEFLVIKIIKKN